MKTHGRRALRLLPAMLLAACVASHAVDSTTKPVFREPDVVEFRAHDKKVSLRAVQFTADSVTGVPWGHPHSPREAYAIADVSGLRVIPGDQGVQAMGRALFAGLGVLALLGL